MPPLPDRPGHTIRPGPILSASPEGFIAWSRVSRATQQGLIWTQPPSPPIPLPTPPTFRDRATFHLLLAGINDLIPYIAEWIRLKGSVRLLQQGGTGENGLRATLKGLSKHSWDIESYLDGIPTQRMIDILSTSGLALPSPSALSKKTDKVDTFVLSLAEWFKSTYMKWIDPIPCPTCSGPTQAVGSADLTPAERAEGGGRVELHRCKSETCGATRRFVRYGLIGPLLRTKEGRCGEWAHLFYAFLRVAGLDARYVWNSEDHVWAEYWSPKKEHWVHVDPCEAAVDKPLLYDKGWGKKQAYCLAFGPLGAEDVTAVYVTDHPECLLRRQNRGWRENILALVLEQYTISLQLQQPQSEQQRWEHMMQKQHEWKSDVEGRIKDAEGEELKGRVSGPEDWRKTRDELGQKAEDRKPLQLVFKQEIHDLKTSDVYLLGDAKRSGTGVVLTTGPSQTSAVFADIKVAQDQSFRTTLYFRMTAPPGSGEADGMAIVFSKDRKLGLGGYGLGYSGLGGLGDFAVELDTYRTQDYASDPPTPHLSVHSPPNAHHRHSVACTRPGGVPSLSDGQLWLLELVYDGADRKLSGCLRQQLEGDQFGFSVSLVRVKIPMGEDKEDWYIGVTGSCGGLWQKQEVVDWKIQLVDILDGASIQSKINTNTEQL